MTPVAGAGESTSPAAPAEMQWAWLLKVAVAGGAALALLHSAASWAGPAEDHRAAVELYQRGDVVGAMNRARPGAEAGHTASQVLMAHLVEGAGLMTEAAGWYRRAAEAGDNEAMFAYGAMLAEGRGVARDEAAARQQIEKAAGAGSAGAVNYMAQAYIRGDLGLPRPSAENRSGVDWIRRSAASGHLPAVDYLARAYRTGTFGEADPQQADAYAAQADRLRGISKTARPAKK